MMPYPSFSSASWALTLLAFLFVPLLAVGNVSAQRVATVRVQENLRAEPQGTVIGQLLPGTELPVTELRESWAQVRLQGWIWSRSIRTDQRPGFDLAVSASPRENLRREPSGPILARLLEGALLEEMEEAEAVPGWTRVRRVAWAWRPSLEIQDPEPEVESPGPGEGGGVGIDTSPREWWRSGASGAAILTGPDGDTVATTRPGTELQVLARQGGWVRVRMEGWVWSASGAEPDSLSPVVVSDLSPEDVARDPEAHHGRVVEWELQFVSREEAERVRTDFYEGEPFLLTRASSTGRTFVYVAVPPERLPEVEGLIPLERIRVVGRIRTGAAGLTGNPILDLMELRRFRPSSS